MSETDRALWEEGAKTAAERQKVDRKKNIHSPQESHHFRSISLLEMQGSEESNLLNFASPRTSREDESLMEKIELFQRSKLKNE